MVRKACRAGCVKGLTKDWLWVGRGDLWRNVFALYLTNRQCSPFLRRLSFRVKCYGAFFAPANPSGEGWREQRTFLAPTTTTTLRPSSLPLPSATKQASLSSTHVFLQADFIAINNSFLLPNGFIEKRICDCDEGVDGELCDKSKDVASRLSNWNVMFLQQPTDHFQKVCYSTDGKHMFFIRQRAVRPVRQDNPAIQ